MSVDWWKTAAIYQVYPRSFQDTDGDGVGDLDGVRRRLGHLKGLGVDAVWVSPFYPSPMADFGYDVADYCDVDPLFGTLADFDALIAEAHALGLKLIVDFVPNHTSDQHPWFLESRSSRDNPKRDWYLWRAPAPGGGPPNNWLSEFGGPAWTFDQATGQYYAHGFLKAQPDLNWRNPEVRAAMHEVLRFWMRRGADGFRVDVIWRLIKDARFRDDPPNPAWRPGHPEFQQLLPAHSADQPENHALIAELRRVVDEFPDRLMIGEVYLPLPRLMAYYGSPAAPEAHLPFNFMLLHSAWNAEEIGRIVREYEAALPPGVWPNWVLGNHDRPRIAGRVGEAQARVAAMLLLTLRGTPTLYYGDEIGLPDVSIPPEAVHDPWEKLEPGQGFGRDPVRTPMQWDASPGAGFTTGSPWLPLSADWRERNVAALDRAPDSILGLHRRLIAARRASPALNMGAFREIRASDGVLIYERGLGGERLVVALNLTHEPRPVALPAGAGRRVLVSTLHADPPPRDGADLVLAPDEGLVLAPD